MKRIALDALFVLVLIGAIGGRIVRSADALPSFGPQPPSPEAHIETMLRNAGWTPAERAPITADYTYAAQVYHKAGCAPLLVSNVGNGGDADGLFRRPGGPAWRFMYAGHAYETPPSVRFVLETVFAMAAPGVNAPGPIIAVAHAGAGETSGPACETPPPEAWAQPAYEGRRTSAE